MSHESPVSNHVISIPADSSAAVSQESSVHAQYLERILKTQDNMRRMREGFEAVLASCNDNQSLLSKAAAFWADVSSWYKIGLGVVVIAPFFVLSVLANLSVLLTLSIVAVVVYAASSILLDNHQNNTSLNQAKLNAVASALLGFFEETIGVLHDLSNQISLELDAFTRENAALALRVLDLGRQVEDISGHNKSLLETTTALNETKESLNRTVERLNDDMKRQSALLDAMQSELQTALSLHNEAQESFSREISELNEARVTMGAHNESMQKVITMLKTMVTNLSTALFKRNEDRMKLEAKLEDILSGVMSGLTVATQGFEGSCAHFDETVEETKALNARHSALLDKQERQVTQLEQLAIQAQRKGAAPATTTPNPHGLFSKHNVLGTLPKSAVCTHYPVMVI